MSFQTNKTIHLQNTNQDICNETNMISVHFPFTLQKVHQEILKVISMNKAFYSQLFASYKGSPSSVLEGRCPAEFSSNFPQHTCLQVSSIPRKSSISCFRCLIRVRAKLCRTPALQDRTWWPLLYMMNRFISFTYKPWLRFINRAHQI